MNLSKSVYTQFAHSIISPGKISYSQDISDKMQRFFVATVLIKTDRTHKPVLNPTVFPLLDLKHQTSITVQKAGDVS